VAPLVDPADLIDSQDVADMLDLSHRSSVTTYLRRYPDFPAPAVERGKGRTRLWLRSDIERWAAGRPQRTPDEG
jgi:hypothetical protein